MKSENEPMVLVVKVDSEGRMVIPGFMRELAGITNQAKIRYEPQSGEITVSRWNNSCVFCGSAENLREFKKRIICSDCGSQLKQEEGRE